MSKKNQIRNTIIALLTLLMVSNAVAFALDSNSQSTTTVTTVSMHDVAKQIRQYKSWQILDATKRKQESGIQIFRFKLLHSNGKVKIFTIDPRNPNLRRLDK